MDHYMDMMEYGYGHNVFPGFPIFMQLVLFIMFLAVIIWVVKSGNINSDSPKDILKKRLAKGEIKKKEYNDLLKEIEK